MANFLVESLFLGDRL